jgi:hypothetical protein
VPNAARLCSILREIFVPPGFLSHSAHRCRPATIVLKSSPCEDPCARRNAWPTRPAPARNSWALLGKATDKEHRYLPEWQHRLTSALRCQKGSQNMLVRTFHSGRSHGHSGYGQAFGPRTPSNNDEFPCGTCPSSAWPWCRMADSSFSGTPYLPRYTPVSGTSFTTTSNPLA